MSIQERKKDHIRLSLREDVQYRQSNGLDRFELSHNALPEVDFDDVSTETLLFGRTFSLPLFISSMTGGYGGASSINAQIARVCQDRNLPFGVGSQRALLESVAGNNDNSSSKDLQSIQKSYSIVRKYAPDAFIAANIGGVQLRTADISRLLDVIIGSIHANAVIVHLNPLQELMQPEGDRNFKGVLEGIRQLCDLATVPVIVKETGAGISGQAAERLLDAGVDAIDVAGAGGTSWAKIENLRHDSIEELSETGNDLFSDWGIDTATCLQDIQKLRSKNARSKNAQSKHAFSLIASGGIVTPIDVLKSICLGADMAASAGLVLKTLMNDGEQGLHKLFDRWEYQLRIALTLTGCRRISDCSPNLLRPAS